MKTLTLAVLALLGLGGIAAAGSAQDALIADYAKEAGAAASADRGKAFFHASQTGGKPDTPSCTTCHTADPRQPGKTRAGKAIDPMAVSVTPSRFTDKAKAEKWFARNCDSVLGRACTAGEKADFIAYLNSL
jgi:mono/diheme cytochrome c family protein